LPDCFAAVRLARAALPQGGTKAATMSNDYPDDERLADEALALEFLLGRVEKRGGRSFLKYLKQRSKQERKARSALARLLFNSYNEPLDEQIVIWLGQLIDPDSDETEREFIIQSRSGRPSTAWVTEFDIGFAIEEAVTHNKLTKRGKLTKRAVEEIAKKYGVSERTVRRIRTRG
jgi:hypothetical protein